MAASHKYMARAKGLTNMAPIFSNFVGVLLIKMYCVP